MLRWPMTGGFSRETGRSDSTPARYQARLCTSDRCTLPTLKLRAASIGLMQTRPSPLHFYSARRLGLRRRLLYSYVAERARPRVRQLYRHETSEASGSGTTFLSADLVVFTTIGEESVALSVIF